MNERPTCAILLDRAMQALCFDPSDLDRIAAVTRLQLATHETLTEAAQLEAIAGAELAISGWGTHALTPAMLDAAPGLCMLFHSAGSIKHLVGDEFFARGLRVSSAAPALAVGVAEFAFGLMLMSMKGVWQYTAHTRAGRWERKEPMPWVREPHGAVVGIVGASRVGREMIRLCRNLSLKAILVYDPYLSAEEAEALGAVKVELDDLMRQSDVVSLHTPPIEACRHIINARTLALMKDRAIFINTGRGMCVDEEALVAELRKGRILACIDVTDPEPPRPDHPFFTLPNCILTPHIAGAIKENTFRQGKLVADQIEAFLAGNPVPGEVRPEELARLA